MKLFSKIYGKGDSLIILHGLFGMSDNWNSIGKRLSQNFEVHLLDLRNHGRSPHHSEFNYEVMNEDLKEYIQDYSLQKAIILGHSLGGKVAMNLASNFPSLLKKMIVIDIAPKEYSVDFHINILDTLLQLKLNKYSHRDKIDLELQKNIKDHTVRLFLMKNLYRNQEKEFAWRFNIYALKDQIKNISTANFISHKIDVETLFIKGEKSNHITLDDYSKINNYFPFSSIKVIKNTGHWVHTNEPLLLEKIVRNFIRD